MSTAGWRREITVLQESDINVRPNYLTYISKVRLVMFSLQTLSDKSLKILVKLCLSFTGFLCVNLFFIFLQQKTILYPGKQWQENIWNCDTWK